MSNAWTQNMQMLPHNNNNNSSNKKKKNERSKHGRKEDLFPQSNFSRDDDVKTARHISGTIGKNAGRAEMRSRYGILG